jgi:MFS superfamily sulfate permease-like transporter
MGEFLNNSNADHPNESIIRLINMDSRLYIDKIRLVYPTFRLNHHITNVSKSNNQREMKEYIPTTLVYKILPDCYFKDENQFKVPNSLLEKAREDVESKCIDYIEKCGEVEFELEKALSKSNLVYDYIHNNYYLLDKVATLEENVQKLKKNNKILKQKYFINTVKSFKNSIRLKNINQMKSTLNDLNKINLLIKQLEKLSQQSSLSNYSEQKDMLKEIMTAIKNIKCENVNIIESIKAQLKEYENITQYLINEFKIILREIREQMFTFEIYGYVDASESIPYVSIL